MPAPGGETWRREIEPDPVLLFRYSAVTFNSHRIHYDQPYATGVEGYPGLVVHGPLIATLLVDLLRRNRPRARLERYAFRALRPLYDTARVRDLRPARRQRACRAPLDARRRRRDHHGRDRELVRTRNLKGEWK